MILNNFFTFYYIENVDWWVGIDCPADSNIISMFPKMFTYIFQEKKCEHYVSSEV